MDELTFHQWLDALAIHRQNRFDVVSSEQGKSSASFGPKDFYNIAVDSLDQIMDSWFEHEQKSWQKTPPENPAAELERIHLELESVVEFETEAIQRDMAEVRANSVWDEPTRADAESQFFNYADEVRKKFMLKSNSLGSGSPTRRVREAYPQGKLQVSYSGTAGTSGVGILTMFLVGVLIGGGPAVFFWDASRKAERRFSEERGRLLQDQRTLQDNMALLQDTFSKLALGRIKNIPQLDDEIRRIRMQFEDARANVERDYAKSRERIMRKTPAGTRLDELIAQLDEDKEKKLAGLRAREAQQLEPLEKQRQVLKDLVGR